jgi:plastocyanin
VAGSDGIAVVVVAGLFTGIAFIVLFSVLLPNSQMVTIVVIPAGASIEPNSYEPALVKVTLGVNNTVRWINQDSVPHGIISDDGYRDPLTGVPFDSYAKSGNGSSFMMPGEVFEFTFREPGEYHYHMEPHPWMQGTVLVLRP